MKNLVITKATNPNTLITSIHLIRSSYGGEWLDFMSPSAKVVFVTCKKSGTPLPAVAIPNPS